MVGIIPTLIARNVITEDIVEAVCIANPMTYDPTLDVMKPLVETIEMFDKYPFITKEEFYDLNA